MDYGTSYAKGLITLKPERKLWQKVKKFMPEKFPATRTEMKNFMKALAAWSLPLVACGLKLAACRLNLFTKNLNACSLTLEACSL
jgi:hypothetical protein